MKRFFTREHLGTFLHELATGATRSGRVFLLGDTSQLLMGWITMLPELTLAPDREQGGEDLETTVSQVAGRTGIAVRWEAPADVIPLPPGYGRRHRPTGIRWPVEGGQFEVLHFDPYSVAFRLVTRGDEPDYRTVLRYLRAGWISQRELCRQFDELVVRFTDERLGQDPAEFRRKFKGLLQMHRAGAPTPMPTPPHQTLPRPAQRPPTAKPTSSH